ncbi:MAG: AAA family ATPase [Pseudomonadota bacterium]|jgi:aminoglycoside phosphotransferase family enzyme/predicted kinase
MESPDREPARQRALVEALTAPRCYPHAVGAVSVMETHISFVLLTGDYAYKIKKALDLGFLDFSTLAKRRFFCEEELRLNRRLAPGLYLDVVPICGTATGPRMGGAGPALEYAVKMAQFPQEGLADRLLERGELQPAAIDSLATAVAAFHGAAARAAMTDDYGSAAAVAAPAAQNFAQIRALLGPGEDRAELAAVEAWSLDEQRRLAQVFGARKRDGFVRECHGDLHLGNIVLIGGVPRIFDCIEFNPNLRWIDVVNEIAFLIMDLEGRGRPDYASRFLDGYLEASGDYDGLRLLAYYRVYRAMVRAKVARIRAAQDGLAAAEREAALDGYRRYAAYARGAMAARARGLIVTHGFSGSGKTLVSRALIETLGAVRIRSDVERKRLHGMQALERSGSGLGAGIYGQSATEATYNQLECLACRVAQAGLPVVVDATFLKRWQRDKFRAAARALGMPFVILDCRAPPALLRARLGQRQRTGLDASEATPAVLDSQLQGAEALAADEEEFVVPVDTAAGDWAPTLAEIKRRLGAGPT